MPITFFKPADSFSVFNKKSNPTLAKCAKAEENLQNKINNIANTLKNYATKHNIIKYNTDSGETTLFNGKTIKDSPQSLKLVADALMSTARFNNELKDPTFIKEISKLTRSLDKYDKQTKKLENKEERAKVNKLREIAVAVNEINNMKLKSKLPEVVKKQKVDSKQEIAEISKTSRLLGKDMTPSSLSARENMKIIIEYFTINTKHLDKKGIFRESGSRSEIKAITEYMDTGIKTKGEIFTYLNEFSDIHSITGAFKEYFKLTLTTGDKKIIQGLVEDHAKAPKKAPGLNKLPSPIQELLPFLAKIVRNNKMNLMTAENLAIVFAPHWQPEMESGKPLELQQELELADLYKAYIRYLIIYEMKRPVPKPRSSLKKDE